MEAMIIIGMFIVTALSLNCVVSGKPKTAGGLNVINLCLIVAAAYQFHLMQDIFYILLIVIVICVGFMFFRYRVQKKKGDAKLIEHDY